MEASAQFLPEIEHVSGELLHAFFGRFETSIDDVNAVRLRIGDVLGHETTKTRQIRRHCKDKLGKIAR